MLIEGGNAFDALAASIFAAAVIEPTASYSLGAECTFMFSDSSSGKCLVLSGQGPSPLNATVNYYRSKQLDAVPTGPGTDAPMAFTVPGVVGASLSMLEKYGTRKVEDVLTPAIEYALDGFPNYEYMLNRLESLETIEQFKLFPPGGAEIFFDRKFSRMNRRQSQKYFWLPKFLASTISKIFLAEHQDARILLLLGRLEHARP